MAQLRRLVINADPVVIVDVQRSLRKARCPEVIRDKSVECLMCILSNRAPASELERNALIPMVRFAGERILAPDDDLPVSLGETGHKNLARGIAGLMRHVGNMIVRKQGDPVAFLLIVCLLEAPGIGLPRWCGTLFRQVADLVGWNSVPGTAVARLARRDRSIAGVLRTLSRRSFSEDLAENWVDPTGPLSGCALGFWLRQYLALPASQRHPLEEELNHQPPSLAAARRFPERLLLSAVAQRVMARAAEIDPTVLPTSFLKEEDEQDFLRILAEVAYDRGGLPRQLRVFPHLRGTERSEIVNYSLGDYRDHLHHVVDVAAVGILLDELWLLQGSGHLLKGQRLTNWFLTSLYHDLGYSLRPQLASSWNVGTGLTSRQYGDFARRLGLVIDGFLEAINIQAAAAVSLITDLGRRFDHGIVSHHYVDHLLESIAGPGEADSWRDDFKEALAAIAKHNVTEEPISFRREPLAALLVLCDEIQDWGRPRWDSEALASEVFSVLHFRRPWTLPPRRMCRRFSVRVEGSPKNRRGTIVLEYADPVAQEYDPWGLVVGKLYALQRLADLPPLKLILRIPLSHDWPVQGKVVSYRDVLRQFVIRYDHPALQRGVLWPDSSDRSAAVWLTNQDDKKIPAGYEEVQVALRMLSRNRPVLTSFGQFDAELSKFMEKWLRQQGAGYPRMIVRQ